jgi:general secretion pathway protein G
MIRKRRSGFTIIEIMTVIIIISLIAVFMAPKLFKGLGKAKRDITRARMANIENAIGRFSLDCGRLPTDSEGLEALIEPPAGLEDQWNGMYLKRSELLDAWKNPIEYQAEGTINIGHYDLISFGADGQPGGEGDNADIYND